MHTFKRSAALALAAIVSIAGCSGEDGKNGAAGTDGTNGTNGVGGGKLSLTIDGVSTATASGTTTATLTFTIRPAATVCPGGTCDDTLSLLTQKTFYASQFNSATGTFTTANTFSFSGIHFKGMTADGNGAQYTATKASPPITVETQTNAFVYGYIATALVMPANGNYKLPGAVASASKLYGTVPYTSTANASGCERCHGAPYAKHGYRMAAVAGLNDFVACKACHTDQRAGHDAAWQLLAEDPAAYAAQAGTPTAAQEAKYAYVASIMNDTHMSHAMEFAYPQTMANCVTCHEGKLTSILTQANFTLKTCKSCHPVTNAVAANADPKRAPALADIMPLTSGAHMGITVPAGLYADAATTPTCNTTGCHVDTSATLKFAAIHKGFNAAIYDATGAKFAVATQVDSASFDATTNILTVDVSMTGLATGALVKPTVVVSLYGYDSKDFLVSGHGSQADGTSNLEYTFGAMQRANPTLSSNSPRLTLAPSDPTAGTTSWTVTADLTLWAQMITDGKVKRAEIAFLPAVGLDQTAAIQGDPTLAGYNPAIAVAGATQTVDVTVTATDATIPAAESYGKAIVDAAKCNSCHDALGTTFHSPNYGSAGVVGCRLCHTVASAGSHLEMQSRSIDSYVHAIHSFQVFDIATIDFADPVAKLRYGHHTESNYPNFAGILNCESCHAAGSYDVPDQALSLPGVLSSSKATLIGWDRNIGTVAAEITGPGARACGSCHRSQAINEDNVSELAALYAHTNMYSSNVTSTTNQSFLDSVAYVASLVGGPAATSVAGAQVEQCIICHAGSGSKHQELFNSWKNGLE